MEEEHNLIQKLPFACPHTGCISSIQLNPAEEGAVRATPRPGFPVLSGVGNKPNEAANRIQTGASSTVSTVETGKIQQGSNSLKEAIRQVAVANKELRDAVDWCEDGTIKGFLDLEIVSINEFMDDLVESTESLMANVDRATEDMGRLAKVEDEDDLDPQPEEQSKSKRAHGTNQSPTFKGRKGARLASPPLSPCRAQEPASKQDTEARGSRRIELRSQGTDGPVQAGTDSKSPAGSHYSPTDTEEIRPKDKAKQRKRIYSEEASRGLRPKTLLASMCAPAHEHNGNRSQQRKAQHDSAKQIYPQTQGKIYSNHLDPITRGPTQGAAVAAEAGGVQDVTTQARDKLSRRVTKVRTDLESHIQTIKNRFPGRTSRKAALGLDEELMSVEAEMYEIIQAYGRRIGEACVHRNLVKERDTISKGLYKSIRRAKALNKKKAKYTDANNIKLDAELCSIEGLVLPKFDGPPSSWPDFYRSFTAILGMCNPAMAMIRIRGAIPQAAN